MKRLASAPANCRTEFVILPPVGVPVPDSFENVEVDDCRHGELLADMQRFRGSIYLFDGAVLPTQLSRDGRHILPTDEESWHVLTLTQDEDVCACLRFHEGSASKSYHELGMSRSAIAQSPAWRETLRKAVEIERFNAHEQALRFGEVGGWAIAPDRRNTLASIRIILGTYGLLQLLGGSVGLATATRKHGSASILRRLGLTPLTVEGVELPSYYDPYYRSEMELLRFDSRRPNPKYAVSVAELASNLGCAPVICAERCVDYPATLAGRGTVTQWAPLTPLMEVQPVRTPM